MRVCMERALAQEHKRVVFEVDSDLVAKHMARRKGWICGSAELRPYFDECWTIGEQLTEKGIHWDVRHIYREFNQTADSLANLALDDPAGNGPSHGW